MTDNPFAAAEGDEPEGAFFGGAFYTAGAPELPEFTFTFAFGDVAADGSRTACAAGACPHPVAHPAEEDWVQLASAVPVEGQLHRFKPRCEGMAYPAEEDFRAAIGAVRPDDADAFSLERLRGGWTEEVGAVIDQWPARLRTGLAALAENWAGDDFDAFAAQADQARQLLEGVVDDIEAAAAELDERGAAIYALQGADSGEIPYPAPLVGVEGEWSNLVSLHVRPAWWSGDCILVGCEEAERALELAGADPGLASQVREFIEEKTGEHLTGLGALVSDVRRLAGEEAKEVYADRVAAELAAYLERQAAIDESIAAKRADQSTELSALRAPAEDRLWPTGADASYMDLAAPETEMPAPPVAPRTTLDPTPVPPEGDGSTAATEADDPWEEPAEDAYTGGAFESGDGGLASGGGPTATTAPSSANLPNRLGGTPGGTVPQGLFGPATGPTATPSTAGGTRGGPVQGGTQGTPPAKGGNGGRKAAEDEEREPDAAQDLTRREIDNVWGYVKPTEDPYY